MRLLLERRVLNGNDRIAAGLWERFQRNGTFFLNLINAQPGIEILELSCTSGAGLEHWNDWIQRHL